MNEKLSHEPDMDRDSKEELKNLKEETEKREKVNHQELEDNTVDQKIEEIDALSSAETHEEITDLQEDLETLATVHKITALQKEIAADKHKSPEQMTEQEIEKSAVIGRKTAETNVEKMIENTSRIPQIIKKNL